MSRRLRHGLRHHLDAAAATAATAAALRRHGIALHNESACASATSSKSVLPLDCLLRNSLVPSLLLRFCLHRVAAGAQTEPELDCFQNGTEGEANKHGDSKREENSERHRALHRSDTGRATHRRREDRRRSRRRCTRSNVGILGHDDEDNFDGVRLNIDDRRDTDLRARHALILSKMLGGASQPVSKIRVKCNGT